MSFFRSVRREPAAPEWTSYPDAKSYSYHACLAGEDSDVIRHNLRAGRAYWNQQAQIAEVNEAEREAREWWRQSTAYGAMAAAEKLLKQTGYEPEDDDQDHAPASFSNADAAGGWNGTYQRSMPGDPRFGPWQG